MTLKSDAQATLDSLLTAWAPQIGANGLWNGVAPLPDYWWAAAAPAAAGALYDKSFGGWKWRTRAINAIEGALTGYTQPNGSFGPTATGDNSIDTAEFGKILAVCMLSYDLLPSRKTRWQTALLNGCEYLRTHANLNFYTNGNINVGNFALMRLAYLITGNRTVGYYAEKAWWTLNDPAKSINAVWAGYGYIPTSADAAPFDALTATAYFTEEGAGGNGLDWDYSQLSLDVLCLLYAFSRENRVARLINLILNTLWPKVDQSVWTLETAGGTRQGVGVGSRLIPFVTPGLVTATTLLGRVDLPAASGQFYTGYDSIQTYYGAFAQTSSAPGVYRGSYQQLGTFLKVLDG